MKSALLSVLLISCPVAASAGDNASLNGKWQIHNSISGSESDMSCTFTQKDNEVTGTCGKAAKPNINGKIDGNNVNWIFKSEYNGAPITLTYRGTSESPEKIKGSVTVEEYGAIGEFTATQSK